MRPITTGDYMHVHGCFPNHVDYTVRLTIRLRDEIDSALLRHAVDLAQQRYPYLSVTLRRGPDAYFYDENPKPIAVLHQNGRAMLNSAESQFQAWAVCYWEDRIHLDVFHGLTDGCGMYALLATLLYYYCAERYGVTDPGRIRTLAEPVSPEETRDPQDGLPAPDPAQVRSVQMAPAFTLETDGGLTPAAPTIWDLEIPEAAFIRFTSAHDASPGTMISLFLARAIDSLYPDRDKDIISAYVINARPMLKAEASFHNCLSMALFPYTDRVKAMPLTRQCTVYRGMTFLQSDESRVVPAIALSASGIRAAAEAAPTLAAKKDVFGRMFAGGEGMISFLVSYTGKWPYPAPEEYIREFWAHPPNTFSLMAEIGAANGKIFLSIQQRFREDCVREAFLRQLDMQRIPFRLCRVMGSDIAAFPEPEADDGDGA